MPARAPRALQSFRVLQELVVEDYAVVDRLRVRFHAGLNLLTGETGSGKSIIVDALGLLLGGRASSDMIRSGKERARVSGVFETGPRAAQVLEEAGFDSSDSELFLDREIQSNGKSRVYVNHRLASVSLLKELAPHLGDIHGQHDQQLLFEPAAQLSMLDAFTQTAPLRAKVKEQFGAWKNVAAAIAGLEDADQTKLRMLDLWQFQMKEIEGAELRSGEDVELEAERRVQQNAGRLLETAGGAFEALYESPESALSVVKSVAKKLDELVKIDAEMAPVRQSLEPALIAIQDASYSLRDYLSRLEANPARLEEIETRLAAIDKLKRKYGGSVDEILAFLDEVSRNISEVETAGERLEDLKAELKTMATAYEQSAAELTAKRKAAAQQLAKRVEEELKPLAMERTVFRIEIEPAAWSDNGADRVQFLVSPNAGEEPRALDRVASGGELSRIALALKTCLVKPAGSKNKIPRTLVFDEIDTGIGGRAAEGVARRLKALATENQVLCVTHLAQIACFAEHHYRVGKAERDGRTMAEIEELDARGSTEEIGRMLSGQKLTPEALRHAAELQRAARA
jgi:DNA repair protein RecN (Recombination protein N)